MLKWIALIFMTIDHIGYYFQGYMPDNVYFFLRLAGRFAFPVFAFYIVKGFSRTSNRLRYLIRMFCWAVFAHFLISSAYFYTGRIYSVFSIEWTNILVLFFFSIIMLMGYDLAMRSYYDMVASLTLISYPLQKPGNSRYDVRINPRGISFPPRAGIAAGALAVIFSFWGVFFLNADYGYYGLLTVLFIHICYNPKENSTDTFKLLILLVALNLINILISALTYLPADAAVMQSFSVGAILFFEHFSSDKKKPSPLAKYFFYFYYPAHISLFSVISHNFYKILDFIGFQ